MVNAVIIEDEKKSRDALSHLLLKYCPDIHIVGCAENVKQGVEVVRKLKPELIFLDVMMPDGSGFDVLEKIKDMAFDVIFTTASEKFAVKAIKYSALDYLLKPVDQEELRSAVKKVLERNHNTSSQNLNSLLENIKNEDENFSKITFPTGSSFEIVPVKEIIRCDANDNYTHVVLTGDRKFLVSGTLKHYEELLPEKDFVRVHHSHLVNINHVKSFVKEDGGYAMLSDGSKVEISRRKKEDFLKRLK